jgi:3-hydroxyisobutyrate dehydrogenase-like beta-hydroxyacid dehydrogenase
MTDTKFTVGIVSPGEMGAGIGAALAARGITVATALAGRSRESLDRAAEAGMADAGDIDALVAAAGVLLSVVPPGAAVATAEAAARAMARSGHKPVFVDCNAISPITARRVADVFAGLGAEVVDAGIVGRPPGQDTPRIYVAGPAAHRVAFMDGLGVRVVDLGPRYGDASALKMVYASMTKGVNALLTSSLLTAERLGVLTPALEEVAGSQPEFHRRLQSVVARLPADAARWADEMDEISATFAAAGLSPHFHLGAGELMRLLAASPFGTETRRTMDRSRTMERTVVEVAGFVGRAKPGVT